MSKHCLFFLANTLLVISLVITQPLSAAEKNNPSNASLITEQPDENNLRLLNVHVSYHILPDVVDAYAYENITLVPIGALSNSVDLAITVEAEKGIAKGSLYDESKTFYLDVARNEVILSGKRFSINRDQIKVYPGDIYVDANLLSKWLPFKLDIDLFSSVLKIKSEKKLPFEEKMDREKRYEAVQARNAGRLENRFPGYFEPYSSVEPPFITATLQSNSTQNEKTGQSSSNLNYAIHGTGDLAKMESSFYLAGTQEDPTDQFRATLGRKDRDGRLLGRMHAREFLFGHIYAPTSKLISRPQAAELGAMVSNYPLYQQGEYDRHDFRGELQTGWEVELYHNNSLIGYQTQGTNGQYLFSNVPLFFGRNHFRLVFFGPQGQKQEETHNFDLESSLAKKGRHYYRAQTSADIDGGHSTALQYDYGLGKKMSISTEVQSLTLGSTYLQGQPAEKRDYTRIGLRGLIAGMFISSDVATDSNNGSAVDLGLSTRIGAETIVGAKGTKLDNLVSESYPLLSDPLNNQIEASIYTAIPASILPRIPISLRLQNSNYTSGNLRTQLDNRISMSVSRLALSNSLSMISATNQSEQLIGQFQLSTRTRYFSIRGDLGYTIQPTSDTTSASVTVDNIRSGKGLYAFGIFQQLKNPSTQYSLNYNRPAGKLAFNIGASYSSTGTRTITFGLTTGFSREPRTPYWVINSRPVSGTGAVSARTFLDRNQDGIYNKGDQLLPNIQFKKNGNRLPNKTDSNGIAFLTGLTSHYPANLSIATETLEDPLWTPSIAGVQLSPRPGSVAKIDFPVLETGEIDGSIYLNRNGKLGGVGDVEIDILNAEGKIIGSTKSSYDGFYLFTGIPNGKYLIRISPDQIDNLRLFDVRPIQVTINNKNQFISGINFRLERRR